MRHAFALAFALAISSAPASAAPATAERCATMRDGFGDLLKAFRDIALAHVQARKASGTTPALRAIARPITRADTDSHAAAVFAFNEVCPLPHPDTVRRRSP